MARSDLQEGPDVGHYHTTLGVGAAQVGLRVLGPFVLHYNDPGLENTGSISTTVQLAQIEPGSVMFKAWAFFEEGWSGPATASLSILLRVGNQFNTLAAYSAHENDVIWDEDTHRLESRLIGGTVDPDTGSVRGTVAMALGSGVSLDAATLVTGGSATSAGIARVYLLVLDEVEA